MPMHDVGGTFYKFREPINATQPPAGYEAVAFEYRGFIITRSNQEYLFWTVTTKEHEKPPVGLRGHFTNKTKAMQHVDSWLHQEELNQIASDKAGAV